MGALQLFSRTYTLFIGLPFALWHSLQNDRETFQQWEDKINEESQRRMQAEVPRHRSLHLYYSISQEYV